MTARSSGTLRAVLFDLDATLIDSAPVWRASYARLAAERGQTLPEDWWETVAGRTMRASTVVFDPGSPGSAREQPQLVGQLVAHAIEHVASAGVEPLPGALRLAREVVAADVPIGIVTSAWLTFTRAVLDRLGLDVSVLVTGDEDLPGKPDPAPYRVACDRLALHPGQVLTIEDSPTGVGAALGAGTWVLAVPSGEPPPPHPRMTSLPTLAGVTLEHLRALIT